MPVTTAIPDNGL